MDRLTLVSRGIPVPELGSIQDIALRHVMQRERLIRFHTQRVVSTSSLVGAGRIDPSKLVDAMKEYLQVEIAGNDIGENSDMRMLEEYNEIKSLNITANVNTDGVLEVKGLK